jgi:ATP-dependent Clp protease protease subunit
MRRPSTGLLTATDRERRVTLRGRVNKAVASCCIARLLVLATEDRRHPIVTYIDSAGGSLPQALAVISTMNGIRCPVVTFCHGQVGAPAALIAAHGLPGFRTATPAARFSFKLADAAARERDPAEEGALLPLLAGMLAKDCGQPPAEVLGWLTNGVEFAPEQALQHGLIDIIAARPLVPGLV